MDSHKMLVQAKNGQLLFCSIIAEETKESFSVSRTFSSTPGSLLGQQREVPWEKNIQDS